MLGRNVKLALALVLTGAVTLAAIAWGSSASETAPAEGLTATIGIDGAGHETGEGAWPSARLITGWPS